MIDQRHFDFMLEDPDPVSGEQPDPNEPDENELETFEGLRLLPEHFSRFMKIRKLRQQYDPHMRLSVRWNEDGEPYPGSSVARPATYDSAGRAMASLDACKAKKRRSTTPNGNAWERLL